MTGYQGRQARPKPAQPAPAHANRLINIGVVDLVPLFRDGVAALVDRTPWARLVAQSASQQGSLLMVEQLRPDVVVLDSRLAPNGQLVQALAAGTGASRIVVVVREEERSSRTVAGFMAAGAHAAVLRTAEPQALLDAVRHAYRAHRFLDPTLTSVVTANANGKAAQQEPAGIGPSGCPLSRREYQVMQLIAEGMENAAIAKVLFLSVETVRTHVKSILRKLSARDRTHAVTIAFRSGLLTVTAAGSLPTQDPPVAATVANGAATGVS